MQKERGRRRPGWADGSGWRLLGPLLLPALQSHRQKRYGKTGEWLATRNLKPKRGQGGDTRRDWLIGR